MDIFATGRAWRPPVAGAVILEAFQLTMVANPADRHIRWAFSSGVVISCIMAP
jgi:hypothetical protein